MHSARKIVWGFLFLFLLATAGAIRATEVEDDTPDVTDRVARISFIRGDVQIRRSGAQDWERAVLNLPIVEGDEITTDQTSRFEIQFNTDTFVRVAERSYVKIVNLKDEGIALSLPEGSMSLRLTNFDKQRAFFEIDAPKTTIAIERSGMYRIDAGARDSSEVRVSATEGGEARVYTDSSGFTLKNGRTAKIFVDGVNAGEWEPGDAARYADEFDSWALERDVAIAKRLKDAFYDKYYDRDIYGAEDLNDHGSWVYTRTYGYVWKPYSASIRQYVDWSPYRYGHWRWIPPYGWTWVNDEPWGWATYHHGRWVWDAGSWYWTPYGYYRYRRSWWSPALVVVSIYNSNICWYPLPYRYAYYNYNRHYYGGHHGGHHNNNQTDGGPTPSPSPTPGQPADTPMIRRLPGQAPFSVVPPAGVVTVPADEFGLNMKGNRKAPLDVANMVLSKIPDEVKSPPILPTIETVSTKVDRQIRVDKPTIASVEPVKTGAGDRRMNRPLDEELKTTRILGGRPPLQQKLEIGGSNVPTPAGTERRKTGAVERPVKTQSETSTPPIYSPPGSQEPKYDPPTRKREEPRYVPPTKVEPPPVYVPPQRQEPPKYEPPTRQETPRYEPPPKRDDPPPQKSEPKQENKPSPPPDNGGRKKDGR